MIKITWFLLARLFRIDESFQEFEDSQFITTLAEFLMNLKEMASTINTITHKKKDKHKEFNPSIINNQHNHKELWLPVFFDYQYGHKELSTSVSASYLSQHHMLIFPGFRECFDKILHLADMLFLQLLKSLNITINISTWVTWFQQKNSFFFKRYMLIYTKFNSAVNGFIMNFKKLKGDDFCFSTLKISQ